MLKNDRRNGFTSQLPDCCATVYINGSVRFIVQRDVFELVTELAGGSV